MRASFIEGPVTQRRSRISDARRAVAEISDGMTVAVGGFINSGHPMALVRELIRRRPKRLRLVGAASSGLEVDMLIAAGCVEQVVAPYVGAEGLCPIGPAFRRAAQEGSIEVFELDEAMYYAGLRAASQGLPFNPWRAGVGTSFPELNPALVEFDDPIAGERLLAIPAIEIDVALLHAAVSDRFGNVQHNGTAYGDVAIADASASVIVQVERIVSLEAIRANPAATTIAGADLVVRAPFGAHPFASEGFYPPDRAQIVAYAEVATEWLHSGRRDALDEHLERFAYGPVDNAAYLEAVGIDQILSLSEY
jgi:glutaconate CoA-transferase subunit A